MKGSDMDELIFVWEEYGKEKDSKLTKNAIELKRKVRSFVRNLPTFDENV